MVPVGWQVSVAQWVQTAALYADIPGSNLDVYSAFSLQNLVFF